MVLTTTMALVGCDSGGDRASREPADPSSSTRAATSSPQTAAAMHAARYLGSARDQVDTASLSILDYLARRWGYRPLEGSGALARSLVRRGEYRGGTATLDRLVDPNAPPPTDSELARSTEDERVIGLALGCSPGTVEPVAQAIRRQAEAGGYSLTHAAFAFGVLAERGCGADALRPLLINRLLEELRNDPTLTDLTIERMAMLTFLGAYSQIPPTAIANLVNAQQPDGAWTESPGGTASWHPTMLALWAISGATPGTPVTFLPNDS